MKNIEIKNQLDAFRDLPPEMDSLGRTREDIEKATKDTRPEVLNSITFKNGKFKIGEMDADDYIAQNEYTHQKRNHLD